MDFAGKRVAVIGTGATGVQVIQTIAPLVGELTVFQRTPNWCTPLHNRAITEAEQRKIKAGYPAMFELLRQTPGCYIHDADPRGTFEVTAKTSARRSGRSFTPNLASASGWRISATC